MIKPPADSFPYGAEALKTRLFWEANPEEIVHYHFNTKNGEPHSDIDGTEQPSDRAARAEAVRYAGEIMSSGPEALWVTDELTVDVTDERGLILFSVVVLGMDSAASYRAN